MRHSDRCTERKSHTPPPSVEHLEDRWLLSDSAQPFGRDLHPFTVVVQTDGAAPIVRPVAALEIGAPLHGPENGPDQVQSASGFQHNLGEVPTFVSPAVFSASPRIDPAAQVGGPEPWPVPRGPIEGLFVAAFLERASGDQTMVTSPAGEQTMATPAAGEQTMVTSAASEQTVVTSSAGGQPVVTSAPGNPMFVPSAPSQPVAFVLLSSRVRLLDREAPTLVSGLDSNTSSEPPDRTSEGQPATAAASTVIGIPNTPTGIPAHLSGAGTTSDPPDRTSEGQPATAAASTLIGIPNTPTGIPAHGPVAAAVINNGQEPLGGAGGAVDRLETAASDPTAVVVLGRTRASGGGRHFAAPLEPSQLNEGNVESAGRLEVDNDAKGPSANELESPQPQEADLLTRFLPFDRASLENAIDQFLDQFEDLGASLPDLRVPIGLVPASLAVAVAVIASDAALRLRLRSQEEELEAADDAGFLQFPGLPNLRSRSSP